MYEPTNLDGRGTPGSGGLAEVLARSAASVGLDGNGGIYVIPIEAVAGLTAIYLSAYKEYLVGNVAGLLNRQSVEAASAIGLM